MGSGVTVQGRVYVLEPPKAAAVARAHTRSLQTPFHRPASMGLRPLVVETGTSSTRAKARLRGDEAVSHPRPGSAKMEPHSSDRCHGLKRRFASLLRSRRSIPNPRRGWQRLAPGVSPEIETCASPPSEPRRGGSTLIRTRMGATPEIEACSRLFRAPTGREYEGSSSNGLNGYERSICRPSTMSCKIERNNVTLDPMIWDTPSDGERETTERRRIDHF